MPKPILTSLCNDVLDQVSGGDNTVRTLHSGESTSLLVSTGQPGRDVTGGRPVQQLAISCNAPVQGVNLVSGEQLRVNDYHGTAWSFGCQ